LYLKKTLAKLGIIGTMKLEETTSVDGRNPAPPGMQKHL